MWTLSETIAYAKSQVGQTNGKIYAKIAVGWESPYDWCAYFCSTIKIKGQLDCPYFPNGFAFDKRDLGVIGDRWVEPMNIQAGDFIGFDWDGGGQWGGDHVGYVVQRVAAGDYWTVEGNCGGAVRLKHRTIENTRSAKGIGIIGGIRPRYASETPAKLAVDGIFGVNTARTLQTRLAKAGCYMREIDGDWGYYSRLALQQYLRGKGYYGTGYLLDGIFGYYSVLALQKYLRKLGEYGSEWLLDGSWGPATTKALQRALNRGVF